MEEHVSRFYTPDNALIVLVGNIDPVSARADVERYFGTIPRAKVPKEEVVTREPEPAGTTRFTMHGDATPRIDLLFLTPGYPDDVLYELDVIEGIFSGRSGRLYRRLVDKEGLCTNAGARNMSRLHSGVFNIWAELKKESDPARVEAIIREELGRAARQPPSEKEIMRVTNDIRMSFVSGLTTLEGLSDRLAWFERINSWQDLFSYPAKVAAVKPATVPKTAATILNPDLATIGVLLPPQKTAAAAEPKRVKPEKKY
jgi:predicted Zn-dependent peptidase